VDTDKKKILKYAGNLSEEVARLGGSGQPKKTEL
jgi:hypothetical protein